MSNEVFQVNAPGINAAEIVAEVQARVAKKKEEGVYTDPRVAHAERTNLANLKDEEEFLAFYLQCLRESVFVDISDFEIVERRASFNGPLVTLKKLIWKMLKFYTYRLWSQQNQVNGLLLAAMESVEARQQERIKALTDRVAELERVLEMKKQD